LHEFNQKKVDDGKKPSDNSFICKLCSGSMMKSHVLRAVFACGLTALLAACGAGNGTDLSTRTAATVETDNGAAQPIVTAATATMPAPDCAADGCRALRVIDANAETFRFDAARRAAAGSDAQS
jgi:hypothetical protein